MAESGADAGVFAKWVLPPGEPREAACLQTRLWREQARGPTKSDFRNTPSPAPATHVAGTRPVRGKSNDQTSL